MAGHILASRAGDPAGRLIQAYLAELGGRLVGGARHRRTILAELEDGLLESLEANIALGFEPIDAATRAIDEFGSPTTVARVFAKDLADARARRTALTLLRTGPVVGALWLASIAANDLAPPRLVGPWTALPFVALGLLICIPAAIVTTIATGRHGHRFPTLRAFAPATAAVSAIGAVAVDVTILGMAILLASTLPWVHAWALVAVAAGSSLTRLILASRAACLCWAARDEVDWKAVTAART